VTPAQVRARAQAAAARDVLEERLALHLRAEGVTFVRQLEFHGARRWRFDFAIVDAKLAIEVQGGTWIGGAHARGSGIERDCEKLAHAIIAGWRVLQVTGGQVRSGAAIQWIKQALGMA
jgi:very-short-patch-repair endonuclease